MNLLIIAVGRLKRGPEAALVAEYRKRLPWALDILEIEDKRGGSRSERQAREGNKILAAIPARAYVVALERTGRTLTSEAFASLLGARETAGTKTLVFLIGGADGLVEKVMTTAHLTLSFGSMTWPHLLARVMLLEQLYRAHAISSHHPYHK